MLLLLTILAGGCVHAPQSLIALSDSSTDDLSLVARIAEDRERPIVLRGLDGVPLQSLRVPNALGEYAYVVNSGRHVLWLKNMPYAHPLMPQRIRCYKMQADLEKGMRYLLREEADTKRALLLKKETGETVSIGELVDEPLVFVRECKWQ
ncbi:hypothetical protein [Sulfurisoma sediminicola]|uniref:hypothetical protein n=1 Tax=Sulfurisoma sediminicola TaxID=1381557 RepID=UPI000F605E52|nr:hypothetical protein [Sulfurisoma sediminicola]